MEDHLPLRGDVVYLETFVDPQMSTMHKEPNNRTSTHCSVLFDSRQSGEWMWVWALYVSR
jgi:hypothetical protein